MHDDRKRYLSAASVSLLGLCSLAIPLWDMWDDVSDLSWSLFSTAVENSPLVMLSAALIGAGYWLGTRSDDAEYVATVAKWTVGIVGVVCVLYAWVIFLQLWAMHALKPWVLALDGVLFSSVVALGVGVYNAEREKHRSDLERREAIHRSLTDDVLDTSNVAMIALDDAGDVVWANDAVEAYFGVSEAVGTDMDTLVAESLAPSLADPAGFEAHVDAYRGTDDVGHYVCRVPAAADGPETDRWLEHRSEPIETGRYEGGRIEYFTDVTDQKRAQRQLETRERKLRAMYDVISDRSLSLDEQIDAIIDIGCDLLDAEYGSFARIDREANEYHVEVVRSGDLDIQAGDTIPYTETWCQRTVAEAKTLQFEARPYDAADRQYGTDVDFEMYVGTPIYDGDDVYGTLCFLDRDTGTEFSDWQLTMVELIGNWISYALQRSNLREELRHRVADREQKLASFVDAVDEYAIFRVDASHRITSWNDGAEATTGYERTDVLGKRLDVLFEADSDVTAEQLLDRAAERGQLTYQSWWERRDGGTFWADVTISAQSGTAADAAGDTGDADGPEFIVIVRDMTDEREYERRIETERERLEFLNRILRHNLLNSLNVVEGRIALLDDSEFDDIDVDEHVGTARTRVEEMTELIERMRTFTNAIVADESHELRPVSLRDAIERKVDVVADSYESVEIDVDLPPPNAERVLADPLLDAVIENVLTNAVVHNDADTPRIEVDTSESAVAVTVDPESGAVTGRPDDASGSDRADVVEHPAITVHVADNGPGIPDEEKSAVLEKGISQLSEPGNGFGLFLVKEMLDVYHGEIHLRDNDPEGTVVDLTFLVVPSEEESDASAQALAQ
ncbi:MAG: PAS domain S-box protein [Haloplanus sp.]